MPIPYTYASDAAEGAHLDGNALGGMLSEIFAADPTGFACRCGGCGLVEPVARALVYTNCPGVVARCAHCTAVLIQIADTPGGRRVTFAAGFSLHFPPAAE
ncbi:DUF6510 family protein [Nocardia yamanashiensis]|uniref:DUF6510 family protein n=1 Tax=Nocardia yamanashiensis TaxID=209247 RepID=UPI000830947A|nr:DUF6510 family protein [Nocardia yamanashiensis]